MECPIDKDATFLFSSPFPSPGTFMDVSFASARDDTIPLSNSAKKKKKRERKCRNDGV